MPTLIPEVSALPTPPSQTDPATFNTRADAFLAALAGSFSTSLNATVAGMNALGAEMGALSLVILNGTGAPGTELGQNGNYYIATDTGDLYYKAAGAWALKGNLKGPSTSGEGTSKWTNLAAVSDFSTTPASTSMVTMNADKRAEIFPGTPIKFTLSNASTYYGICTSITSNAMGLAGAPLVSGAGALTALSYGTHATFTERIPIPGYWSDSADASLISNDLGVSYIWRGPPAYLVQFGAISHTTDSGTNKPRINVRIGSTTTDRICTANSGAGLEIAAAETWYRTGVDIDTTKYALNFGDQIEITTDGNGGNDDASQLKPVEFTVVYR